MITLLIVLAGLQVTEWGVISESSFSGNPGDHELASQPVENQLEDRAPVLYFHGDPCTVTVRVNIPGMGYITSALPEPDQGGVNSTWCAWNRLELTGAQEDGAEYGWPGADDLLLPSSLWREVDALDVVQGGNRERFLYYSCVPGSPGDLPFISQSGNRAIRMPYGEIPCIVLTRSSGGPMYGVFTIADIAVSLPKGLRFLEDPRELRRELRLWAEGVLREDEFDSFWNTWENEFTGITEGEVMVLYPVPGEILEGIASLEVVTDDGSAVEISRFVVAHLPYR